VCVSVTAGKGRLQKACNLEKIAHFSMGVNVWQLNKYMIMALIALVTGPNSTLLRLVQFMPVTREVGSLNYNIPMCDVSCVKAQVNWGHRQQY